MAQINATSLRAGSAFLYEGKPFLVLRYNLIKIGRGGATVKVSAKNLETGSLTEQAFSSNLSFEEVNLAKKKLQYLYQDGSNLVFMNPQTYEQVEIAKSLAGEQLAFIKEGEELDVLFMDDKALSVDLPPKVTLTVKECDPGVRGNSATNLYKPAVLENGLKVKVPLFIKVGEKVRIDTRNGEYVERAK